MASLGFRICVGVFFFLGIFLPLSAQPLATDLGELSGVDTAQGALAAGEVSWFRFRLNDVKDATPFLDITTNFRDDPNEIRDTELALFDSDGALVSDLGGDEGFGLLSTLSFGVGSGHQLGDAFNLGGDGIADGEHGPITPGVYYAAVAGFDTNFGNNWQAQSNSDLSGEFQISIFSPVSVPEPTSTLWLIPACALLQERRRAKRC